MNKLVLAVPLAAVLAVSMIMTPAAYGSWVTITDTAGDATNGNADFDITAVGITDDGNVRLNVAGEAGATIPSGEDEDNLVYAYVFLLPGVGIVAVTSHQAEDSAQVGNDLLWHSHRVTLDGNFCVTSIEDFGKAIVKGNQVQVLQTGATDVDGALTVELTIGTGVCVSDVWDEAPDGVVTGS